MSWETALIGTVLSDPASYHEAGTLVPSDFVVHEHQILWAEISAMIVQEGELDTRTIVENLRNSQDWAGLGVSTEVSPERFIANLIEDRGTTPRIYADRIVEESMRRAIQRNAALIAAAAQDENKPVSELVDYAENQIMRIRRDRTDETYSMADLMGIFIPRMEAQIDGSFVPIWQPAVPEMLRMISYAEDTETILIAGRPGHGKSSYLRYEFYHAAMGGKEMVIFNLDNDKMDYPRNLISLHTGIDNQKIKNPQRLNPMELNQIKEAAKELSTIPLTIVNTMGWSAQMITRKVLELKQKNKLDVMAVDYVQQIRNPGSLNNNDNVGLSMSTLRSFGGQHGIPQLIAAQLSRDIERRSQNGENALPQNADLRDSGNLEQDATIICFPRVSWKNLPSVAEQHRFPENILPNGDFNETPTVVPVRFYITKNRNGPIGPTREVAWNKSTGDYYEAPPVR